jgi:hypothetical protein
MWRTVSGTDLVRADYHTAFEARGTVEGAAQTVGAQVEEFPDNGLGPARGFYLTHPDGRGVIIVTFDYAQDVHPGGPWFCVQLPNERSPLEGAPLLSCKLANSIQNFLSISEDQILHRYPCLSDA